MQLQLSLRLSLQSRVISRVGWDLLLFEAFLVVVKHPIVVPLVSAALLSVVVDLIPHPRNALTVVCA